MVLIATPGQPYTAYFSFYTEENLSTLVDPDSVTLDITTGGLVDQVADAAGPFTYQGGSSSSSTQVYRLGTGQYAFTWDVPPGMAQGGYTCNWTVAYQGDTDVFTENFYVAAGGQSGGGIPVPAGDIGYWTGSIAYTPAAGTPSQPVTISIGTGPDENGISWLWNKITGWDSADVQGGGVIPKSGDHGAWASPQYYAARQFTLVVTASAPTQALRDLARALFQQAIPVSDMCLLTYDEPVPKQVLMRRAGKVTENYLTLCDVQFTAGLVAPDPRKYSTQPQIVTVNTSPATGGGVTMPITLPMTLPALPPGGSVAVTNAGNFETRPLITITGPITSPALVNVTTGQQVSWSGLSVPAGQAFAVDFSVMQATLGGAYRAADAFSSWWTLPPGTSTVAIQGQGAAGSTVSVSYASAWV